METCAPTVNINPSFKKELEQQNTALSFVEFVTYHFKGCVFLGGGGSLSCFVFKFVSEPNGEDTQV